MKKYYITTPIYYPSGKPHVGHCYTNIVADTLARWHKLLGEDVFLHTGTDEHGQKIERLAKKQGISPKQFVDKMVPAFKELAKLYNMDYDKFTRTTDKNHEKYCQEILQKVYDKGDIYKGKYEGWYCVDCETYYNEKDLEDGCCPLHKKKAEWFEEESYFFKMSKYAKKVEKYIQDNNYIIPKKRQTFLLKRMKDGIKDLCISREKVKWGIPVPFDKKHTIFVWFDALLFYLSGIRPDNKTFWPPTHVTSHDIMWHHSVIWLSMLFAAGIKPPKKLVIHGFINAEGGIKMSKSLGNVIDPFELAKTYPTDSVRYFILREIPFGSDGAFSVKALKQRHNNELVNDLGNLQSRTLTMIEKYFKGKIPRTNKNELVKKLNFKKINDLMLNYELHNALSEIWKFVNECNKYINANKPWELAKSDKKKLEVVLYNLAESLRIISILIEPFMPNTSKTIKQQLGLKKKETFKDLKFGLLGNNKINKNGYLFTKIEQKEIYQERKISFSITPEVKDLGIDVCMALVNGAKISNKNNILETIKKETIEKIKKLKSGNALQGYIDLYNKLGVKGEISPATWLRNLIKKNDKLPNINTVVDSYNLISAETMLSVGAHDLKRIKLPLQFKITDGSEKYTPLGEKDNIEVNAGEYACTDGEKIVCRLDVKQCDQTKITKDTKEFMIYVQGNKNTTKKYLRDSLIKICELIKQIAGGSYEMIEEEKMTEKQVISTPEAGHYIPFEEWGKMKLRVGKIKKAEPHPNADKLYVLLVDMGKGENPRQIVSGLKDDYELKDLVGKQIVVFTNLQPTKIRGIESNGMLLAAGFKNRYSLLQPDKKIETGARIS